MPEIIRKQIDPLEHAGAILSALPKGVLLTAEAEGKINTMTIGWGTLGIEWQKPIFIAFVREGRYTRELLDRGMNFTVNVPYGPFDKRVLGFCGTKSGRDVDKIEALGLHTVMSAVVAAPAILELPLTLECEVVYRQLQDREAIPARIASANYPADVGSENPGANKDYHIAYYGEIAAAYVLSERDA